MADSQAEAGPKADPLLCLRESIASNATILTTTSAGPTNEAEPDLSKATHIQFTESPDTIFSLNINTRFESTNGAVDLRSIYFAWLKKDVAIPDYITATQGLNEDLDAGKGGAGGRVQNLSFPEKVDLITWLEGASDDSEYIRPLAADQAKVAGAASVAAGTQGGIATIESGAPGRKTLDPRLKEILNGERRTGDRNSVLHGIKPTDFSHVRKQAEPFLKRLRATNGSKPAPASATTQNTALVAGRSKPGRSRADPIILLSPSASSLLRLSNIKSFLDDGVYTPSDSSSSGLNILHIVRTLPSIDPNRPFRFILVDSPDQFRPDYWSRVVAVFTTGQTWQFKSYKWQQPPDLFSHALGVYVGWKNELVPSAVKSWGRGVITTQIDAWNSGQSAQGRWRDREVVEAIWSSIEESMRVRGWSKEGLPAGR